jgi:NADH:ubiquinone oxidoreductase subunit E
MAKRQPWDVDRAQSRIQELERLPGALLPILNALQDESGYADKAAIPLIADAEDRGVKEGDLVSLASRAVDITLPARLRSR